MGRKPRYLLKHPGQSKGRFKRMLGRRFMVRFHMTLIVLAVLGAGLAISKFLLWYGVRSMAIRYPMVVLGGLVTFLICIRLWLWYIHSALVPAKESGAEAIDAAEVATDGAEIAMDGADIAMDGADIAVELGELTETVTAVDGDAVGAIAEAGADAAEIDGEAISEAGKGLLGLLEGDEAGIILVIIAVVVAVILGVGVFLIWQAPIILAEAAFPAILAASLRRKGREIDHPHWTGSVLKAVWVPALFALLVAFLAGFFMQAYCPTATKMSAAVKQCVLSRKKQKKKQPRTKPEPKESRSPRPDRRWTGDRHGGLRDTGGDRRARRSYRRAASRTRELPERHGRTLLRVLDIYEHYAAKCLKRYGYDQKVRYRVTVLGPTGTPEVTIIDPPTTNEMTECVRMRLEEARFAKVKQAKETITRTVFPL